MNEISEEVAANIKRLAAEGRSQRDIAKATGAARNTVRRIIRTGAKGKSVESGITLTPFQIEVLACLPGPSDRRGVKPSEISDELLEDGPIWMEALPENFAENTQANRRKQVRQALGIIREQLRKILHKNCLEIWRDPHGGIANKLGYGLTTAGYAWTRENVKGMVTEKEPEHDAIELDCFGDVDYSVGGQCGGPSGHKTGKGR